jgi:2-(3-amino-3-carboxypropyl)histidine synthase
MKEAIKKLKKIRARRVFVQFPEGLTLRIQGIAKELERNGFEAVVCIEKCFGACDVKENEAKLVGCDAILHIGHEQFIPKTKLPVVYWEYFIEADPVPILEKKFEKLKDFKKIGLITSIQFVKSISTVKEFLEKRGKKVFIHKALQHPGQVLGCSLEAAKVVEKKVDCFLCISAGEFYADGVVLATEKPVFSLDLERKEVYSLEDFRKKIQKIVAWNKAQLKDAKKIGLLVSWKKGQMLGNPFKIKEKLEKEGKEVYVLAMDEITPEKLEGLKLDAVINCGCPRIGIDDTERYKMPIINWSEIDL